MPGEPISVQIRPLFEPFNLKNLSLPNRIVMAPMTRCYSPDGIPGEDVAAYYRKRAEGGVGLIMTEGTWIPHAAASNEEKVPRFYSNNALAGWRHVLNEVHAAGARIMPQLWHTGLTRRPKAQNIYEDVVEDLSVKVSPSGYVMPGEQVGKEMTSAEIEGVIDAYATGAENAQRLGFDGVEIHGAHGYLVDQFFWHETNLRTDRWGGRDLAARSAFGVEMIRACRSRVSKDFPIVLRFSQWKMQDYAARLAETPRDLEGLLTPLADAGVDIFHASQRRFWEPEFPDSDLNLAGWAKRLTGKPSITVGSVGLGKELHESMAGGDTPVARIDRLVDMLARGDFDLVAVGRALLSEPNWANKVRRNALHELKPFNPAVLSGLV